MPVWMRLQPLHGIWLADPNSFDTIEVGYLDGVALPFLDDMDGWTIDGREYKVRIDAAASALEYPHPV